MAKDIAIKFPAAGGLFAAGPYLTGVAYAVPDEVAAHLLLRGAELAPSADDTAPLTGQHYENFAAIRAQLALDKPAEKKPKANDAATSSPAPAKAESN